jgi:hypothetical protein
MKRSDALPYVSFVVDDALAGGRVGEGPHAEVKPESWLIGWQCGFEPLFVAVNSSGKLCMADAEDIAKDYLRERGWFADDYADNACDYAIAPKGMT